MKSCIYSCVFSLFFLVPFTGSAQWTSAHPGMEWNAVATGNTHGHVIDLVGLNTTGEDIETEVGPLVIPSGGEFQGYVINHSYPVVIPAFGTVTIPLEGYCTDYTKLAQPKGLLSFPGDTWVDVDYPISVPGPETDVTNLGYEYYSITTETEVVLTYPGSTISFPYRIDIDEYILTTGATLVEVVNRIEDAYDEWYETEGQTTTTVLTELEESEMHSTVVQYVFWYYTSILRGEPMTQEYFTEVITRETEIVVNTSSDYYTETTLTGIREETESVWSVVSLIGNEAKILKKTDGQDESWGIHYQRWTQEELAAADPYEAEAGLQLAALADTLNALSDYLGRIFIGRIQSGIAVKMGDFFKFQLGGLRQMDQLGEWIALEKLTHTAAFGLLEPGTQEVIRGELKKRMDGWVRAQMETLDPQDLEGWIELEEFVGWDVLHTYLESDTRIRLRDKMGVVLTKYTLQQAQSLNPADPASMETWAHLELLSFTHWYEQYVSSETQAEVHRVMGEKLTAFLNTQLDQLQPGDTSMIVKWQMTEVLVHSDWFSSYVSEADQKEIIRKLGEKFTQYLITQAGRLDPADSTMIEDWRKIEVLVLSDWFTTYVTKADQEVIKRKLKEKFTAYMKTQADRLDPSDEGMLDDWIKLEKLIHSSWFTDYVSEADREEVIKKLKEKFTAYVKKRLDELDPKDPDFMDKWIKLQKLTLTSWFGEYLDNPRKADNALYRRYDEWYKTATEAVDYSQIRWEEVGWTGERIKIFFGPNAPATGQREGFKPWIAVVSGVVPVAGAVTWAVIRYPLPPEANPDALTINCPGEGTVNVLVNDTGKEIRIVNISQPAMASVTDQGFGDLKVSLLLTEPTTQFTFTYTIEDRKGRQDEALVTVNVMLPEIQAVDDSYEGFTGTPLAANVLNNDVGQDLLVVQHTEPAGGNFEMTLNGSFTYVPDAGFCETASFTYTAKDECGQTSGANVTIQLIDNKAPEITCPPEITISCEFDPEPSLTGQATATDNCTAEPTVTYVDEYGGVPCDQLLTRTWTATDEAARSASCDQLIHIIDETAPAITCPDDITIPCEDAPDPELTGMPEYADNCTEPADLVLNYEDQFNGTAGSGLIDRTWTVTDECGHEANCTQVITLEDLVAPLITCPPDLEISCEIPPDPSNTGFPEVSDNCGDPAELPLTYEDELIGTGCPGDILRTWTVEDGAGNNAGCTQLIMIIDITAPVITCPADITVNCGQELDLGLVGTALAIDECGGPVDLSFTDDLAGVSGCEGEIIRTWVAVDICGNASFCIQVITLMPGDCPFTPSVAIFPSVCGAPNGEIALDLSPPGEYVFLWSNGLTGPVLSNLLPGPYDVTITDPIGFCTEVLQLDLPEAPPVFILNTEILPDICLEPGNITLTLEEGGSGLYEILVNGPTFIEVPPQPPGEVVLGNFGPVLPGVYTIIVQDPAAPPGCWQELEIVVPYFPPYTLEVVSVIPPSSPSASDGEVLLTVDADPPLPLDVLVNGVFVGQANSYFFSVTGLSEGVYDIMIVADGGNGCESNIVTVDFTFVPAFTGSDWDVQLLTMDLTGPPWAQWADDVLSVPPVAEIPEHPELLPSDPASMTLYPGLSFGMGYSLTERLQLRWQLGHTGGQAAQNWLEPATGSLYTLATSFRGLTNDGGLRYFGEGSQGTPFLGAGMVWRHLSFENTRLTGPGLNLAPEPPASIDYFSAYLSAGMRWRIGQRGYLELEGRMGTSMEFVLRPAIGIRLP